MTKFKQRLRTATLSAILSVTLSGCGSMQVIRDGSAATNTSLNAMYWIAIILAAKGVYEISLERDY